MLSREIPKNIYNLNVEEAFVSQRHHNQAHLRARMGSMKWRVKVKKRICKNSTNEEHVIMQKLKERTPPNMEIEKNKMKKKRFIVRIKRRRRQSQEQPPPPARPAGVDPSERIGRAQQGLSLFLRILASLVTRMPPNAGAFPSPPASRGRLSRNRG